MKNQIKAQNDRRLINLKLKS